MKNLPCRPPVQPSPALLASEQIALWIPGNCSRFDPLDQGYGGVRVHDKGSSGVFSLRSLALDIKAIHDLRSIPNLSNLEGKKFTDTKSGSNPQCHQRPIAQA
jgi:hypothetical protein